MSPTIHAPEAVNNPETQTQPPEPYQAPIEYRDGEHGKVIPGEYLVILRPGHTLTDHSLAVGADMEHCVKAVLGVLITDRVVYSCSSVGDEHLARMRADEGVEVVQCNFRHSVKLE